ncbi:MAG: DUF4178 domain-containing protein [Desulfobacteraceae bacterium 4572_89]|nr:MAG: DUF4178 domain-containing protein [Desulfobacteraceae bacterium 4572_89]
MIDTAIKKSFDQRFSIIRTLEKSQLILESDQAELTLMDAGKGSFFTYFSNTYYIQEKNRYQEMSEDFKTRQDFFITEFTCLCLETGQIVYFEWEFDDELKISMTLEQTSFRHIKDEEGQSVDEDDLDQIAEDKDVIVHEGEKFWYEDDWAALYQREGKEEKVYMYEFENENSTLFLTIEEWSGSGRDEYRIYRSKPVNPGQITIICKGAG